MQEVLRRIEQVQEIDLQINAILAKKADFPKRLGELEAEIKTHQTKYDEKKKIVDELEKGKRQQSGALELNEERSKRSQEKLELIKTNQEYHAIQHEITYAHTEIKTREDQILELMVGADEITVNQTTPLPVHSFCSACMLPET